MNQSLKQKIYTGIAVLAVVILISGASIIAVASPATSSDPLISLGYLTNQFRPSMISHVTAEATRLTGVFNTRASQAEAAVASNFARNTASTFRLVDLSNGGTLAYQTGSEIMLRAGSANFAGALINHTSGSAEQASGSLVQNNMFVAVAAGTITATANGTQVLIKG